MSSSNSENNNELSSKKGIDYKRLKDFLKAGEWYKADKETSALLIAHLGEQAARGYLKLEDVIKLPHQDLRIIDQLWVRCSNGRFGLSVQKQIFKDVDWCEKTFLKRVGWNASPLFIYGTSRKNLDLYQKSINFNTKSPTISFPFPGLTSMTVLKFGSKETAIGHLPYSWLNFVEPETDPSTLDKLLNAYLKVFNLHSTETDLKAIFLGLDV